MNAKNSCPKFRIEVLIAKISSLNPTWTGLSSKISGLGRGLPSRTAGTISTFTIHGHYCPEALQRAKFDKCNWGANLNKLWKFHIYTITLLKGSKCVSFAELIFAICLLYQYLFFPAIKRRTFVVMQLFAWLGVA